MKQFIYSITFFVTLFSFSQEEEKQYSSYFDVNYFKGNIAVHNNDILHLVTGHPDGFIASWSTKTFGFQEWEQLYNYPDKGLSFIYQDLKNPVLGENFGLYGHYNFYFLKRNLMLRLGQGVAYASDPYDKEENFRNVAFGTRLLSSTYIMLQYKKEHLIDKFGVQAGFSLIHYSNANVKAPNASVNSMTLSLGVTYNLEDKEELPEYQLDTISKQKFKEPIRFNGVFRSGINESDYIGTGQFPFYIVSAYADKRLNKKSAIQFGTDVFFSKFLKEHILFRSIAFPEDGLTGNEDYKRVGLFVGHELFINKSSLVTQYGYYLYYPYDFEGRTYIRVGVKRYFGEKWFGALTLKSHGARAEGVELGIGIRL